MSSHPAVVERLAKLQVDQRRAATAPPGPVLCVAPAGSGKTTTLVARIAWLVDEGAAPETICAITFNKRAAVEMTESILKDKKKILPCAAYLEGEYGVNGLYVGVPCKLGARGLEQVIEITLTAEERIALQKSAAAVQDLIDVLGI